MHVPIISKQASHPFLACWPWSVVVALILAMMAAVVLHNCNVSEVRARCRRVPANMHTFEWAIRAYAADAAGRNPERIRDVFPYMPGGANRPGGSAGTPPFNPVNYGDAPIVEVTPGSMYGNGGKTGTPGQVGFLYDAPSGARIFGCFAEDGNPYRPEFMETWKYPVVELSQIDPKNLRDMKDMELARSIRQSGQSLDAPCVVIVRCRRDGRFAIWEFKPSGHLIAGNTGKRLILSNE